MSTGWAHHHKRMRAHPLEIIKTAISHSTSSLPLPPSQTNFSSCQWALVRSTRSTAKSSPAEASRSLPFQTNKFVITAAVIVLVGLLLKYLSTQRTDPREPPLVKPRIPLIGHLVGLIRYQNEYFTRLGYVNSARRIFIKSKVIKAKQ